jgi:hypothetical protein
MRTASCWTTRTSFDASSRRNRVDAKLKRQLAEKVLRRVTQSLAALGFDRRKPAFWVQRQPHRLNFFHIHLFRFGPQFRVHCAIRVLNDSFAAEALNGIDSDGFPSYELSFAEDDGSVDRCARAIVEFCTEKGLPWFAKWSDASALVRSPESPLLPDQRKALRNALEGKEDPKAVQASERLFNVG